MSLYLGGIGHFKIYWKPSGPSGVGGEGVHESRVDIIYKGSSKAAKSIGFLLKLHIRHGCETLETFSKLFSIATPELPKKRHLDPMAAPRSRSTRCTSSQYIHPPTPSSAKSLRRWEWTQRPVFGAFWHRAAWNCLNSFLRLDIVIITGCRFNLMHLSVLMTQYVNKSK